MLGSSKELPYMLGSSKEPPYMLGSSKELPYIAAGGAKINRSPDREINR
jgi:hypothetical protein